MTLDDDVARAVERLRREEGLGTSEVVNTLARRGLSRDEEPWPRFVQRVSRMGQLRVPLDDIGSALEVLEGEAHHG